LSIPVNVVDIILRISRNISKKSIDLITIDSGGSRVTMTCGGLDSSPEFSWTSIKELIRRYVVAVF